MSLENRFSMRTKSDFSALVPMIITQPKFTSSAGQCARTWVGTTLGLPRVVAKRKWIFSPCPWPDVP
jgi:hypothetical protein